MSVKMPKPQGLDQVSAQFEMKCPFCQFHDRSSYILLLHIEEMHPDGSASVIPKGNGPIPEPANDPGLDMASSAQSPEYIICDVEDCGEPILMTELDSHMDLHYAEQVALKDFESAGGSEGSRTPKSSSKSKRARKDSHSSPSRRGLFGSSSSSSSSTKKRRSSKSPYAANGKSSSSRTSSKSKEDRLGKSDLGPYADEDQMPSKLRQKLEEGGKIIWRNRIGPDGRIFKVQCIENETENLIMTIGQLCEKDPSVAQAWLCHPSVKHVGKQGREGGFCGYRNIQMMISYIQAVFPPNTHPFEGRIPTILKIQDWIEEGWDLDINANGRIETGGIKGTRKYIGTSEADTLFTRHGIKSIPVPFHRSNQLNTQLNLLNFVENYFKSAVHEGVKKAKVYVTPKPPIYFQQPGHSMTIIGLERTKDGWQNLLVFDPVFTPSPAIKDLEGARYIPSNVNPATLLKAYRRGIGHLQRFKEFEVLTVEPPAPPS